VFFLECGTIASRDDCDDIVNWGNAHLALLRGFAEFHFGIPCANWQRNVALPQFPSSEFIAGPSNPEETAARQRFGPIAKAWISFRLAHSLAK
jgi:hypothetical protein